MNCAKTIENKEVELLRKNIKKIEINVGKKRIGTPIIKKIIIIMEQFIKEKKLISYGGTAVNNLLPFKYQFYNKNVEIPDYDMYSSNALNDAKELADIYYTKGFTNIEAKAGKHYGTYKVFVNFMPIADITHLDEDLFLKLKKTSIQINNILYAPPNFLRMAMYLELSRPKGDVSRWEKIFLRLSLLNKVYPIKEEKCNTLSFINSFENDKMGTNIYNIVKNIIIENGGVFFGGYACNLYKQYTYKTIDPYNKYPDFDVLIENPDIIANNIKDILERNNYTNIKINILPAIGTLLSEHYEVMVDNDVIIYLYKPLACISYNTIKIHNKIIKIASIDTMLSFYLIFLYTEHKHYDIHRILCMAEYLINIQKKNRLSQKGLVYRFTTNCYGEQETKESIMEKKSIKYKELYNKKNTLEYDKWFLNYTPSNKKYGILRKTYSTKKISNKPSNAKSRINTKTRSLKKSNTQTKTKSYKKI